MGKNSCCCCCRGTWLGLCCSVIALIGSLAFLAAAYWAFTLHQSLTPVFRDVDCTLRLPELAKVSFEGGFHTDFLYGAECYNPNPYHVAVRSAQASDVYMGKKLTKVASVMSIPEVVLPAFGHGTINTYVDMSPTANSFSAMFGMLFTTETTIWLEASLELVIDVDFRVTRMQVAKNFTKLCGFKMQVFRSALAKVGGMACADRFETLDLPDVGDQAFSGKLDLNATRLAKKEVEQGEMAKNVGLGMVMLLGVLWGLVLCCCGCSGFKAFCCPSKDERSSRRRRYENDTEYDLRVKAHQQARELRILREQLAEEELRRQYAEQERKFRAMKAKLAKQGRQCDDISIDVD